MKKAKRTNIRKATNMAKYDFTHKGFLATVTSTVKNATKWLSAWMTTRKVKFTLALSAVRKWICPTGLLLSPKRPFRLFEKYDSRKGVRKNEKGN